MADGPAIQAAGLRALKVGQNTVKTLDLVRRFRAEDADTPVILMGYFNPIYIYGVDRFLADAKEAGVDGLIVVDLPPEEDDELCLPALKAGLAFIRLATPTTDDKRLPGGAREHRRASSITFRSPASPARRRPISARSPRRWSGSSGTRRCRSWSASASRAARTRRRWREGADGVVVGSALIDALKGTLDDRGPRHLALGRCRHHIGEGFERRRALGEQAGGRVIRSILVLRAA